MVADALYIVKVEPLSDAVTWAPSLPASGTYQVYAKWTADETRATDASYSIVHSGGTAAVTVNQRVGGGLWHYLGSYAFDPLSNPTVTLAAKANGSVAADAIRFVGGPGGATDVAYLHTDHLGTPQAMTDANAQVLWWRDQTPFGQAVATGGFSQNPLRFPGQIADAESGLAYDYFRDYDPALGRYIQSDPIGLGGGLNTYGYVGGNPIGRIDPRGLDLILIGENGGLGKLFELAAKTWDRENCGCNEIVHVGTGDEAVEAIESYASRNNGVDGLQVFAHSASDGVYFNQGVTINSLYSDGAGWWLSYVPGGQARIEEIDPDLFKPGATIQLFGCNTGDGDTSFAEALAKHLGRPVTGSQSPTHFEPSNIRSDYKGAVRMVPDNPKKGWTTYKP